MKNIIFIICFLFPLAPWAHSGRTDSSGCHHDRKSGGYHCHNQRQVSSVKNRAPNQVTGSVLFNTKTRKYHSSSCTYAKRCTVNCVSMDLKRAQQQGGVPCKVCGG